MVRLNMNALKLKEKFNLSRKFSFKRINFKGNNQTFVIKGSIGIILSVIIVFLIFFYLKYWKGNLPNASIYLNWLWSRGKPLLVIYLLLTSVVFLKILGRFVPHRILGFFSRYRFLPLIKRKINKRIFYLCLSFVILIPLVSFAIKGVKSAEASWWGGGGEWAKRQRLNVVNSSSDLLASGTTVAVTVDTKSLADERKVQDDCDDVRIVYQPNDSTQEELSTFVSPSGGVNCSQTSSAELCRIPRCSAES